MEEEEERENLLLQQCDKSKGVSDRKSSASMVTCREVGLGRNGEVDFLLGVDKVCFFHKKPTTDVSMKTFLMVFIKGLSLSSKKLIFSELQFLGVLTS